jgi:cell division septation protein DedD
MTKIAVIYYSATGNVHAPAEAVGEGAAEAGAQVGLRRVAELRPAEAIDSNPAWRAHVDATADIQVATTGDVRWADGLAFGSPARFGYGTSHASAGGPPGSDVLAAARYQGRRLAAIAESIVSGESRKSTAQKLPDAAHAPQPLSPGRKRAATARAHHRRSENEPTRLTTRRQAP